MSSNCVDNDKSGTDFHNDLQSRPLARATTAPASWYGPDHLAVDLERVLEPAWQLAGLRSRWSSDDHLVRFELGNHPLIVVRDGHELRAFYNVCQHRGGPLALEDGPQRGALRCKYHGWCYNLDGRLRKPTEFAGVEEFDPASIALRAVALEQLGALVMVNVAADPSPATAWRAALEAIPTDALDGLQHETSTHYDIDCNWKTYVDNYLEGYHLPFVHPGLSRQLTYQEYTTVLGDGYSLQHSPFAWDGAGRDGEAYYVFVFPNLMLNVLPGRVQTNVVLPLTGNRCRVLFDYYYAADFDPALKARDQRDAHQTQLEDIAICEQVQRGLNSPAYERGRLSVKREAGVHHFHDLLRAAYAR